MTDSARREFLPGMLDMLILKTLTVQPRHGYGIAQHLAQQSRDVLRIEEGSLYPALQRMRQKGWITAEWRRTPNNQRARFYTLTPNGRKQLAAETRKFAEFVEAVSPILLPG